MQNILMNSSFFFPHRYDIYMALISCIQHRMARIWLKWDWLYALTPTYRIEKKFLRDGLRFLRSIRTLKEKELAESMSKGVDTIEISRQDNTLNWIQKCFHLYQKGRFTEENLIEEIDTIYVGGTDTSTVTIVSSIIMMAIHQEIQDRVVAELRDILGDSPNRDITYEDVIKMNYLEMVIKESLRHFPVGPFLGRQSTNDIDVEHGTIPKDSFVLINVMKLHKDPNIWGPNVDRFYPEHFLPENINDRHPYSYIPFSAGPRNCIGIKYGYIVVKVILAYLLRKYKLSSDLTLDSLRPKVQMIIKIANPSPVRFENRKW